MAAARPRLDACSSRRSSAATCSGAWAGHVVATMDAPRHLTTRAVRTRQVPLAAVMVALTTLTLWSLGQAIVVTAPSAPAAVEPPSGPQAGTTTLRG